MALLKSSDFQRGTIIGCHLSNKSVCQISALLELPGSPVSAVTVKWKCLGAATAQPQSGEPHKLTERESPVLKYAARKNCLSSVATLTTQFQTASVSNVSTRTVGRELHEMGFHGRAATHASPCVMPSVGWSSVKLTAILLWRSGNAFAGEMNHASPPGSPTEESGFGGCQENATCLNA